MNTVNVMKVVIYTGLCLVSSSIVHAHSFNHFFSKNISHYDDKNKTPKGCNIYKDKSYPKEALKQCKSYCEKLNCANPCSGNSQSCADALTQFQALNIGDPVCVAPKRAYITNFNAFNSVNGNTVTLCTVKPDGSFENCIDSGVGNTFDSPLAIIANKKQDTAYITNYGNTTNTYSVSKCAIRTTNPNLGEFSACTDSGAGTSVFYKPFGIVFNKLENTGYITNNEGSPSVEKCTITNGTFSGCIDSGAGTLSGRPTGIALNKAETLAYITTDTDNTIIKCQISSGMLSNCALTGSGFSNPLSIVLNNAGNFAYVTNYSINAVLKCGIDVNGDLVNCADAGAPLGSFNFPFGLVLNKAQDAAYVANYSNGTVSRCTIDFNPSSPTYGNFITCTDTGVSSLNGPTWLMLTY